jgi:hypothetical protein
MLTNGLTMSFKRFEVVRVPFPFTDKNVTKNRPALVLSDESAFNAPAGHSVMAMITSAEHAAWPLDCVLQNLHAAGLCPFTMVVKVAGTNEIQCRTTGSRNYCLCPTRRQCGPRHHQTRILPLTVFHLRASRLPGNRQEF